MKAPIESPLTLEEVAAHFEQWRKHKKNGERIPEQLWKEAVSLVDSYGVSQVTRTLRRGGSDLNQRREMIQANRTAQPSGGETAFVEVDPVGMDQAPEPQASAVWMELERPDGLRLRIRPSGGGGPTEAGRAFHGGQSMLQLTPQSRVFLAVEPADFRKRIDGLAALCRQRLGEDSMGGAIFVFRNRRGTSLRLLCYDGQGFWLCQKRWSQGRLSWWPTSSQASERLAARELQILLWNGNPKTVELAEDWRRVA